MGHTTLQIGARLIGSGQPTFIVAEIGANHNGDPVLAKELIHAACEAGVDAVKFQLYTAEELLADRQRIISWGPPGGTHSEAIGAMFDRIALERDVFFELFAYAKQLGTIPFATPFSAAGISFLDALGASAFKVASSDVTHLDFLREMARTGKPVILSLGKSTLGEVDRAVGEILRVQPDPKLALLHCTASYPAPWSDLHLRFIATLSSLFPDTVVGFSDHSHGTAAAIAAVTLGARIVEKHFTLDTAMEGPDHWFSADPGEMAALVRDIRNVEEGLGGTAKRITPSEQSERETSTRSLVLRKALSAGTALRPEDIKVVRPGWGIHPHDKEKVVGLRITRDLDADTVLQWEHFRVGVVDE